MARQRRATILKRQARMTDYKGRRFEAFRGFVGKFVAELEALWGDGWAVLVEGSRDEVALRRLGYHGTLITVAGLERHGIGELGNSSGVVILTDLDREGGVLASRYFRRLGHEGFRVSLAERRRLKIASRGVFLHIENLSRFVPIE